MDRQRANSSSKNPPHIDRMRRYGCTRYEHYDTDGYIKAARARENRTGEEEIASGLAEAALPPAMDNECFPDCPFCYPKDPPE